MASVSFGLNRGVVDNGPDNITVGTLAVSTSDVELRWDNTKSLTREEIIMIMTAFQRRLEDDRFNDPINV
jgi:hypothetical protein